MIRPFGQTGLAVSPLGLGLAAAGRPGYINLGHDADVGEDKSVAAMQSRATALLDAAWSAGIRYIDTARSYGQAEAFLADWLAATEAPDLVMGFKWGYRYTADWQVHAAVHEIKQHDLDHFQAQLAESRALLGDHLALYQVHSATLHSGLFDAPELLDALARLRDEGVVVGLSLSGPSQADTLRAALDVRRGDALLFGAVQATWNLLERSVGPALAEAHEAGLGVIIKEALANGRLTDRGDAGRLLGPRAAAMGLGTDALALAAVLAQPFVHVVLSGAATVAHLTSNLRALDVPNSAALDALGDVSPEAPDAYWAARSRLAWN